MSFPGPQKDKIEYFVYELYKGNSGKKISKQDIMPKVQKWHFAPDTQVFFEELPDQSFDEQGLINALNHVITSRGRAQAIGGTIQKVTNVPPDWQQAHQQEMASD